MDGKTFEDLAFDVISRISPVKLPRNNIPFDSVREIVLNEINHGKRKHIPILSKKKIDFEKGIIDFDDMDELISSESSSTFAHTDDEGTIETSSSDPFDPMHKMPPVRTLSDRCFDSKVNKFSSIHHNASAPSLCSLDTISGDRKKALTYKERRITEMRMSRIKNYRGEVEVFELNCEESSLSELFDSFYWKTINDSSMTTPNIYFHLIDSLDSYFRSRTWDNNCNKLCCEFLHTSVYKTCQQLNNIHDTKDSNDTMRVKELMLQVLIGLHVFSGNNEHQVLDDTISKLRLIYITSDPQQMKSFLEEPVTDIFVDKIAESLANIYDELCIALPADLAQFDNGFKILDIEDNQLAKKRNVTANKLDELLAETSSEVGSIERKPLQIEQKKGIKRRLDNEKELSSPSRRKVPERSKETKKCFVDETPDEKYKIKEEIDEEIDEIIKQTPMAKLRMAKNTNGRRCSKRLSDMVKLSEERTQIPKRARVNMEKMLEKAKSSSVLRTSRRTPKSILFSNNSPSPLSTTSRSSRTSLQSKFSSCISPSSSSTTPVLSRKCSLRSSELNERNGSLTPKRSIGEQTENMHERLRVRVKKEIEDEEFDEEFEEKSIRNETTKGRNQWSDRRLRSQLGLTRDDLNRYKTAMLATGMKKQEDDISKRGEKKVWENMQVNRAGRVKGGGGATSENGIPVFGIKRRQIKTFMCHVLLNDSNPDMSFDWSKVDFDVFDNKPRTRSLQTLLKQPQQLMESLKRKYLESKSTLPTTFKRIKMCSNNQINDSNNKKSTSKSSLDKRIKKEEEEEEEEEEEGECSSAIYRSDEEEEKREEEGLNDFGLESEASD